MGRKIKSHRELRVYQGAVEAAMEIFELTKGFPAEEKYALVDQIRHSSRSVCANVAEAWRKRRYKKHFASKLSDAESEAEEIEDSQAKCSKIRVWIEFAFRCDYLEREKANELYETYDRILAQLVTMRNDTDNWTL